MDSGIIEISLIMLTSLSICRCYYLCQAHATAKNYAQSLALNSRGLLYLRELRNLIQSSQEPLPEEAFFPLTAQDVESLTEKLEEVGLQLKKEWFAFNGGLTTSTNIGADGKKHKKPLFFDVAFNYIQSPIDTLEERAGKVKSPDPITTSVGNTGGKKGKVDVEEVEHEDEGPTSAPEPTAPRTSGGLGGLLGSWWGRR